MVSTSTLAVKPFQPYATDELLSLSDADFKRVAIVPTAKGAQDLPSFWRHWLEDELSDQHLIIDRDAAGLSVSDGVHTATELRAFVMEGVRSLHPVTPILELLPLESDGIIEWGIRKAAHGSALLRPYIGWAYRRLPEHVKLTSPSAFGYPSYEALLKVDYRNAAPEVTQDWLIGQVEYLFTMRPPVIL